MEIVVVITILVGLFVVISKDSDRPGTRARDASEVIPPKYRPAERRRRPVPVPPQPTPSHSAINAPVLCGKPYVIDGDSLVIQKVELRLFGIDAPEFNHPFGKQAKWALHGLCKGHEVRAECVETDSHGRTVAKCFLPDGRDLSAEMVKLGLAIDWPKFSGGQYREMEVADARKKMWLADARQKGRMHIWVKYEQTRRLKRATDREQP
ncbi:MAG: thermonuclease family protein [Paracoccaceae bacterium]|nr:thermonuclease family protein [Paracoccaceae bacterium]